MLLKYLIAIEFFPILTKMSHFIKILKDINIARAIELQKVYYIGPVYSNKIIDYRNKYGLIKNIYILQKNIKGIGPIRIKNINNMFTVFKRSA